MDGFYPSLMVGYIFMDGNYRGEVSQMVYHEPFFFTVRYIIFFFFHFPPIRTITNGNHLCFWMCHRSPLPKVYASGFQIRRSHNRDPNLSYMRTKSRSVTHSTDIQIRDVFVEGGAGGGSARWSLNLTSM